MPVQRQLSAHRHGEQLFDSLNHHVTNKAFKAWKPCTANFAVQSLWSSRCRVCAHVCACTASAIGTFQQASSAAAGLGP